MARTYMKIHFDFKERASALTPEEQGRLLLALLRYASTGEREELSGNERFLYPTFCMDIDRDTEIYEAKATNGKQGGRPKKELPLVLDEEEEKPKETKPNQTKPEETSIKNKNKNKEQEQEQEYFPPESPRGGRDALAQVRRRLKQHCFSCAMEEKILEWLQYKVERKEKYKEQGLRALLRQLESNVARFGDTAVCELIDESMASGWKGILFDRLKEPSKATSRSSGRNVDPMDYVTGPAFGWGD